MHGPMNHMKEYFPTQKNTFVLKIFKYAVAIHANVAHFNTLSLLPELWLSMHLTANS